MMQAFRLVLSLSVMASFLIFCCGGCEMVDERLSELAKRDKNISLRIAQRKDEKIYFIGVNGKDALREVLPLLENLNVVRLGVGRAELTATDLDQISRLPLQELTLGMCTASADDLKRLGRIGSLEQFNSSPSLFADDDLEFLQTLKRLKRLRLNGAKIRGDGLRYLDGLDALEEVVLTNCPITDEGLKNLPRLPRLESINLNQTQVTARGLRHLVDFTSLKKVYDPGLLSSEGLELHRLHLEARKAAREQGKKVPTDDVVPYHGYANMSEKDRYYHDESMKRDRKRNLERQPPGQ